MTSRFLLACVLLSVAACGTASGAVVTLTSDNFHESVKEGLWLVEFMAPWCGHCQQLKPIYAKAATALEGKMRLGAVDATAHDSLREEFGITSFPSVKLFRNGDFLEDYDGARTVEGFSAYYETAKNMKEKGPSDVVELTSLNFSEQVDTHPVAIVKFYAPWCGHCKALAPTWEKVASQLKPEGVLVAKVDVTSEVSLQSEHSVAGFPTIKLFKRGKFKGDHKGGRTAEGITSWMRQLSSASAAALKGGLTKLIEGTGTPTFVLIDGTDKEKKLFNELADEEMIEDKVAFATIEKAKLTAAEVEQLPKTANVQGDMIVVNSGEIVSLKAHLNEVSMKKFVEQNSQRFFHDTITPGENFNDVMYTKQLSAVIHVSEDDSLIEHGFIKSFRNVATKLRGQFVFGKLSSSKHAALSDQVGMFKKFLPGLVVFDSQKLKYYSDRQMGRSQEAIEAFLQQVLDGKAKEKTPGDEKASVGDATAKAVEKKPTKLYDDAKGAKASGTDSASSSEQTRLIQELIKSQNSIREAILQIKDEIIDLRTDIEPMSGGVFTRKPVDVMAKGKRSKDDPRSPLADPHTGVLVRKEEKPRHQEL